MKKLILIVAAFAALCLTSCDKDSGSNSLSSKVKGTWVTTGATYYKDGGMTASFNADVMSPLYWMDPLVINAKEFLEKGTKSYSYHFGNGKMIIEDSSVKSREITISSAGKLNETIAKNSESKVNAFGNIVSYDTFVREYTLINPISNIIGKTYVASSITYYYLNTYIVGKGGDAIGNAEITINKDNYTFAGSKPIPYTDNFGVLTGGAAEPFVKEEGYVRAEDGTLVMVFCMEGTPEVELSDGSSKKYSHWVVFFTEKK